MGERVEKYKSLSFLSLSSPLSLSLHKSNLKIRIDRNIYFPSYGTKSSEFHKIHMAVES